MHYWAEDNFLVSLHYGVNDYPLNSSPNSDHWNLIKPHSHDTDWALPSSLSQSQPPCPAGLPIWLPRRAARIGTRSSPGPHQWTERPGFCVVWTRWIWCKCFWSNLRDSRSDKRLVIWTCRWAGRTRVLSSAALLGPDGGHSAASRRHCFRRWGSRTTFYRLVRPTWSIFFSCFNWFFKVFWDSLTWAKPSLSMKKWPLKPGLATPRPKAPFCFLASQTHLEAFSWIEYTRVNQNFVTQVTISLDWKIRFSVFAQLGFTWRSGFEYKPIGLADSILLDHSYFLLI